MPPAAPGPRLTRASLTAASPRQPQARAEAAGVAAGGIPPRAGSEGRFAAAGVGGGRRRRDPRRPRARLRL